jgi:hypothetical protein
MTDYTRTKNKITDTSTGDTEVFKSINQAKKASRKLQQSGKTISVIHPNQTKSKVKKNDRE